MNWKYYDIMSDIFREDKTINPNVLMSFINTSILNQEDWLDTENSIAAASLHTDLINILQSNIATLQQLTKNNSERTGQSRLDFHRKSISEID